ncbi:HpcH/HpaI aldolase/citrate lyase family protein [Spelaeicoccus albus]|uniref:Citrate lyase subunit beta/citryl-CoA lyase n=1 Tax=Spelaeicoccus albus TaxID=1280376 RepID=A0A7Z0A8R5_9MICO|nr:CoA ester lyase [Spelaeicoccus albus]NYI65701.1 citrate lyase subunit beta/citryl-CoA lyase [Spelaeicoccus albus]
MPALSDCPAWLFCPADRPDRYSKAAAAADVVIVDLEDAVAASDKAGARTAVQGSELDPARTVIRINPAGTRAHELDVAMLRQTRYTTVMLPKADSAAAVSELAPWNVVALIETPLGVVRAAEIAAAQGTIGMMWGAEDLVASLGGGSSRRQNGEYRDVARHARSVTLVAAAAFDRFALDAVHLDIADEAGLADEARDGCAVGFSGTACIHPSQVPTVRSAYRPTAQQTAWAERVLAAAQGERGVFSFDGTMVDAPVLRHAEQIVHRAGRE